MNKLLHIVVNQAATELSILCTVFVKKFWHFEFGDSLKLEGQTCIMPCIWGLVSGESGRAFRFGDFASLGHTACTAWVRQATGHLMQCQASRQWILSRKACQEKWATTCQPYVASACFFHTGIWGRLGGIFRSWATQCLMILPTFIEKYGVSHFLYAWTQYAALAVQNQLPPPHSFSFAVRAEGAEG